MNIAKESCSSVGIGLYVVLLTGASIVIGIPVGLIVIATLFIFDLIRRIKWVK